MLPFLISGNGFGSPRSEPVEAQRPISAQKNDTAIGVAIRRGSENRIAAKDALRGVICSFFMVIPVFEPDRAADNNRMAIRVRFLVTELLPLLNERDDDYDSSTIAFPVLRGRTKVCRAIEDWSNVGS